MRPPTHSQIIRVAFAVIVVLSIVFAYKLYYAKTTQDLKEFIKISLPRPYGEVVALSDPLRARTMAEYRADTQTLIDSAVAAGEFGPPAGKLSQACALALRGGARLRSTIVFEVARMLQLRNLGAPAINVSEVALFNEYLHTASLIIDDMPEFDDDLVRRGGPSVVAFAGRAVAQMAAISLVSAAFGANCRHADLLAERHSGQLNPYKAGAANTTLIANAIGAQGAAQGQLMDISSVGDLPKDRIMEMISLKTAVFFELAMASGWVSAGGAPDGLETVRAAGRHLGVAYQIADDISDAKKDAARAASAVRADPNFANAHGASHAHDELHYRLAETRQALADLGLWSDLWEKEIFPAVRARATEVVN